MTNISIGLVFGEQVIGSKIKILDFIDEVIEKYNIKGETLADLFSGTACS